MHEGKRSCKTYGSKYRTQRLASFSRIYCQRSTLEILVLIFLGLGPLADFDDLLVRVLVLNIEVYSGCRKSISWSITFSADWVMAILLMYKCL